MDKPTVGVFFGSRSAEHDVSIVSAIAAVIKPLEAAHQYNVVPIYIAKDGRWYSDPELADITTYQSDEITDLLDKLKPLQLEIGNGLTIIKPSLRPKRIKIDIAFPVMHGTFGEDGALMGLFEMAGVPYVGCGPEASAIAMNKILSKRVAVAYNIATSAFVSFDTNDLAYDADKLVEAIKKDSRLKDALPLFVKPARLGSSIGISRVDTFDELAHAIEVAAHYDNLVIVEEGVKNLIEVTVPVMGNENPRPAMVEKPLTNPEDFFDFDKKYIGQGKKGGGKKGGTKGAQGYSEIPAKLPKDLYQKAEQTALDVYRAVGCSGTCRVDLLIDSKSKIVYFNELNPMPGSLYAHNWSKAGVSNVELVTTLIDLAKERFAARAKLQTTFDTSFLKQF